MAADLHHCIWMRKAYTTPSEKRFRQHEGLVIPMYRDYHNELHAEIAPVAKMCGRLIVGCLEMLDNIAQTDIDNPLWAVEALVDHLGGIADKSAQRLARQLDAQMFYLEEGFYLKSVA